MAQIEIRKRKNGRNTYRVRVRVSGFSCKTATFEKLAAAKAWSHQLEADMRAKRYISTEAACIHTAAEMIDRYLDFVLPVKSDKKRYIEGQRLQLLWWRRRIGDYHLIHVTGFLLSECRDELRATRSPATVNRYFAALNHVFTTCINEWGWLNKNPLSEVKKYTEPRGRCRYLTSAEIGRLLMECRKVRAKPLYDIVVVALATGARKDEILSIEPKHVDLALARVILEETKNNERRKLSLSGAGLEVVTQQMQSLFPRQKYLFCGRRRIRKARIDDEFRTACDRASIKDFRFHDLRHTFASHLAMNGASLHVVAEALGHKTLNMVKRYAHLADSHTSAVIASMNDKMFGG